MPGGSSRRSRRRRGRAVFQSAAFVRYVRMRMTVKAAAGLGENFAGDRAAAADLRTTSPTPAVLPYGAIGAVR